MTIQDEQPVSVLNLGKRLARDKAQMTRHIQMLERKGLVSRETSNEDRRVALISLTQRGEGLVGAFQTALSEVVEDLLSDVDESERAQLADTIRKMVTGYAG